jgi:hypothetical protein
MKRYLILLLAILVLASGLAVGCGQSQKQRDILLLDYLDKINALIIEYADAISAVMGSYKISQDAVDELKKFPDDSHFSSLFEAVSNEKEATNEALQKVNDALSFLETTSPPREAKTLHSLMIESFQTARDGLLKLSHFSGIRYEILYSALNPSIPKKELPPPPSEELTQGLHLMGEAIRMLDEARVEADNLLQPLKRHIPR